MAESDASAPADPVTRWKGFQLLDFQIRAIRAIREGRNVLLSAPTGAGKTLVAEYAIADAVRRGRRCVYTAPVKALSNQKYRDFRDDPEIDVGLMTGDVTIRGGAQVVIVTTEILRNQILEDPSGLHDVDYVILDEVHFMDDVERGSVWEESLIFAPEQIRMIALSATIANLEEFGAWLGEIRPHDLEVIQSRRRPVPLKHRLYTARGGIFDVGRLDWVTKHELAEDKKRRQRSRPPRRGSRGRGGRGRGGPPEWAERRRREEAASAALFDELQREALLPTLVFSFSRKDCERLASKNQHRRLFDADERAAMADLQEELVELFQLGEDALAGDVFRLASQGVAYHHAGMLPVWKEVVERMFTSGLLKLLFTTETFALGINMPARTVVFGSLRKFDGVSFDYLRTRDYMQMAGRAGRQGIDDEGLVVSLLELRDLEEAPLRRILSGKPEPILSRFRLSYSTILHLLEHVGREKVHEAWDKSFNRFQHRGKSRKARESNQRHQRRVVDGHLALLGELGYFEADDRLTPKGRIARLLPGYELQITEMLFNGALENLPPAALAVVFAGLIFEERRSNESSYVPPRLFGGVRRHVSQVLGRLAGIEAGYSIPTPMKLPEWGLTPAVVGWFEGAAFEELSDVTDATPGDLCRTLRMTLQLLRQVRRAIDPDLDLSDRLRKAFDAINRDEVDARRQLELG